MPTDKVSIISERTYFLVISKYRACIARNTITISLCEETKLSIITKGFSAKKATPKTSSLGFTFLKIFPMKYAVPRKDKDIRVLKRKKVGRKNCNPRKDNGVVRP